MQTNRKYKDSVFTNYLGDEPARLIEVYNAAMGTNYPLDTPVEINTLDNVLYMERMNDLSFVLDGKLVVLIEHQSTINDNMALRMLLYIGRLYEKLLDEDSIYRRKRITIPSPVFLVFYNGERDYPEHTTQKLSESFRVPGDQLELTVEIHNINYGKNESLIQKSKTLKEYTLFIYEVRKRMRQGESFEDAVQEAIRYCIKNDVMKNYLQEHGSEVENMLFKEWDMDRALEIQKQEGIEEGMEKGREKGMEEAMKKLVLSMSQYLKEQEISKLTEIPLDKVQQILKTNQN